MKFKRRGARLAMVLAPALVLAAPALADSGVVGPFAAKRRELQHLCAFTPRCRSSITSA